jgi:hypothetical protein
MKKMTPYALLLLLALLPVTSCSLFKQARDMKQFAKCEFRLKDVQDATLAGVYVQEKKQFSDLSFAEAGQISMSAIRGKLPLGFTLRVEVRNPNPKPATMNSFLWELYIDDVEITNGKVTHDVYVPPDGGITIMPVSINVDLFQVLSEESADAIINFGMNLSGSGGVPSRIKLRAKPNIWVAGNRMAYPGYITIRSDFVSE